MPDWWHEEPIRLVQTNLREADALRSAVSLVRNAPLDVRRAQDRAALRVERLDLFDAIHLT